MRPFSDPVLIFASVMVLILLSPIIARRLHLPEIVGLIVAGMVFGDHGFGLLARDDTMKLLGQVGLLFIMFLAGLEIDLHQVKQQRSHSLLFGLLTFALPMLIGVALGQYILGMTMATAILMSSMFSSHTLLTFPTVGRLGLSKSRATTTTIGGTIITDTLALLVLAVVAAACKGDLNTRFWVFLTLKIVLYLAAVLTLVPPIGRWFLRHFPEDDNLDFIAVLAIAFTVSYLAHTAGLEPIIGAFLAGLILNPLIPEKGALMRKIHFVGNALFIPFFLLTIGMLVNLQLLWQGGNTWVVIAVMIFVALLSKWLAAHGFGLIMGYRAEERGLIYGLSVNQAAATLAAALVGYDLGLFDDGIITGTIAMIGVTCFVGPVITEKHGKRLAALQQRTLVAGDFPHRIIIPIHSTARDKDVLDLALFLRRDGSQEPLYPVNVVFEGPRAEAEIAASEKLLDHMVMRSLAVDVPMTPMVVIDTNIASGILRTAREKRTSILCMVWDGEIQGRPRMFGHTIDRVIDYSSQLVLVTRLQQPLATTDRILLICPPMSHLLTQVAEALSVIKTLARQSGAKLCLLVPASEWEQFQNLAYKCRPDTPLAYVTYQNWRTIRDDIDRELDKNDWVVVLAARLGQISWQPQLDRLPRLLAGSIGQHNLSFVYPPLEVPEARDTEDMAMQEHAFANILREERCALKINSMDINEVLRAMLSPRLRALGRAPDSVLQSLVTIAQTEPVELLPGLVLLHQHCPEVDQSEFFLGSTALPLIIPQVTNPCRLLLVLLDPMEQDPVEHLAALNDIARLIKYPGFLDQAFRANTYDELAQILRG